MTTTSDARKRLDEARALEQACEICGPITPTVALGDLTASVRPLTGQWEGDLGMSSEFGRHEIDGMGSE